MRILFISHYFYPEGNAPATRVFEMTAGGFGQVTKSPSLLPHQTYRQASSTRVMKTIGIGWKMSRVCESSAFGLI